MFVFKEKQLLNFNVNKLSSSFSGFVPREKKGRSFFAFGSKTSMVLFHTQQSIQD